MTEENNTETYDLNQRATLKLMKMSKGYNWEIRLVSKNGSIAKEMLDELEKVNLELLMKYGERI